MGTMTNGLPKKLKTDSIVEAVVELQFRTSDVSEVIVGRLAGSQPWAEFTAVSLPAASLPPPLRRMDASMAHLPLLERRQNDQRFIRIGDQVLSCHRTKPYVGWDLFGVEVHQAVDVLFASGIQGLLITRIGLRYINAFTQEEHGVASVDDLALKLSLSDRPIGVPFTLAFQRTLDGIGSALVKVAEKALVLNPVPPNLAVLLDVDIFTADGFETQNPNEVHDWIERAHEAEKREYIGMFTEQMKNRLVEI